MVFEHWKEISLKLLDSKKVDKPIIGIIILLILIVLVVLFASMSWEKLTVLLGVLIIAGMAIIYLMSRDGKGINIEKVGGDKAGRDIIKNNRIEK